MMTADSMRSASNILFSHWAEGTRLDTLPEQVRPTTREDAYRIQALLEERSPAALFGWKIAATSAAGQAHIGVDGPLAGRILAERVIEDGGTCPYGNNLMRVAEVEFAFRMGRSLDPRDKPYEQAEVLDAVSSLHPAIEIPDSRFDHFERVGAPQLIADDACANYFVLGPAASEEWRDLDLSTYEAAGIINGGESRPGIGSNVLGDPRIALQWLVNELSRHGTPVRAGEVVTTGTCLPPMPIAPGDHIVGEFGRLGRVSVTMGD